MRRIHRHLGLALVPWMLAGGVASLVLNRTSGFAAGCDRSAVDAQADAQAAARRAWGHLMAKASLAGERVDLVAGTAGWLAPGEESPATDAEHVPRPRWASDATLLGFELPPGDRPEAADARLVFLARGEDRLWRCTVALDGRLSVDPASQSEEESALHGSVAPQDPEPGAVHVDLLAVAMLLWGATGCVVLWRSPRGRRSGLLAMATGAAALAAFVTTI